MDELIGKQNPSLPEDHQFSSVQVPFENAELIEEEIISQSLDLKDWILQIQSQAISGSNTNKERSQLGCSHSRFERSFSLKHILRRLMRAITGREYFEILKVELVCYPESEFLLGGYIDLPREKDQLHGSVITARGWILGKAAQAVAVQIKVNDIVILEMPVHVSRPDVIKAFVSLPRRVSRDSFCGFHEKLSIKKLPDAGFLRFQAVLADGNIAPLGFIQFRK